MLASGIADPGWPTDGRILCTALNAQYSEVASDSDGGAIVTWQDERSGRYNRNIYAQHVSPDGVVDPLWPANGLAVCTAAHEQEAPTIVGDDAGGAIITWQDARRGALFPGGIINYDVYAQHVLASGAVDERGHAV